MLFFIISDLHVGDGGPRDDWIQHPEYFDKLYALVFELQDALLTHHGQVQLIILGDLYNAEYGPRACIDGPTLRRVMGLLRPFNPIYCVGNHDSETWDFRDHPIFRGYSLKDVYRSGTTFYMHGHQVDMACGRWSWIGKSVSWMAGAIGRLNPAWEDALRASGGRDGNSNAFARLATRYAAVRDYQRVICGHSHEPQIVSPTYCNAGLFYRDGWLTIVEP